MKHSVALSSLAMGMATVGFAHAQSVVDTSARALTSSPMHGIGVTYDSTRAGHAGAPKMDDSQVAIPPPVEVPPGNPADSEGVCMVNGGRPFTVKPISIGSGGFKLSGTSTITGRALSRWAAVGSYTVSVTYNGATKSVTDACTRANSTFGMEVADACVHSTTLAVGGGTFVVRGSYTSPVAQDWVAGTNAPYSGKGSVEQTNCK